MGVQHIFTSAYHPQSNGQVRRFNRTIIVRLRTIVGEEQGSWDHYSSAVTYANNPQVHTSIGYTPSDLILTRPHPPSQISFSDSPTPVCFTEIFRSERGEPKNLRDRIRQQLASLPLVRENLTRAGLQYKRYADRYGRPYDPYDLIRKRVALRREINLNKLIPHGLGLYRVHAADENTVTIATIQGPLKILKDRVQ
jgi:hypothetical protein